MDLTEEEAIEEILADSTWELVQSEDIINELCKQNRSLAEVIVDAIKNAIEKLKAILTGNVSLYEPRIEKKLYEELGIAEEVAKMWADGIAKTNTLSTFNHRGVSLKFSMKDDFATQIDEVLNDNGNFEQTHLYMGETPKVLTNLGLRNLPMLITAKHIYTMAKDNGKYKKANYHNMGADLIKQLPKAIAEPIGIMESATKDDSVVVITELIDRENRPVVVAVKFNGYGNYNDVEIEANIVASSYGKDNVTSFINKAFSENRILYWNNKKARTINTPRLQLPNNIDNSSFATTVSLFKEKVNRATDTETFKFSIKDNGNNLTAKQYFNFGWATANGVLNTKEAVDFFDKLKYVENKKYPKSKDGDYIIEVGEKDGINNKLVYTNGDWNDPRIYKVVTINVLENETILDKIREKVYYCEKHYSEISQRAFDDIYEEGIISESFRTDWDSYEEFRAGRERGSGEEDSREDRGLNGRGRNTGSDKKYSLKKQDRTLKKLYLASDNVIALHSYLLLFLF